jgi:hypothetical protein
MVTVDLRRKLQAEKCPEHGDMQAHLNKLQTMREDLASMGVSVRGLPIHFHSSLLP